MELYRKYRPEELDDVIGNEGTVASLRNMIERGTLPHVLLFHGPSGCGKTTLARIVRRALDCSDLDYREVNSGSFRGIDTVRDVTTAMTLSPGSGKVRVWLFDEVHRWTGDAQNAALKILEDTPSHVYFFLCTTDPQKLLKAILTRCCEMPVRALAYDELEKLVKRVAKREKIELSSCVLDSLVANSQGSARTALVLLDKISNLDEGDREQAIADRLSEENEAIDLCRALIANKPWKRVAEILKDLKADPEQVRWSVLGYARSILLGKNPDSKAYEIIVAFERPFYDSKMPGLAAACWECVHGAGR